MAWQLKCKTVTETCMNRHRLRNENQKVPLVNKILVQGVTQILTRT